MALLTRYWRVFYILACAEQRAICPDRAGPGLKCTVAVMRTMLCLRRAPGASAPPPPPGLPAAMPAGMHMAATVAARHSPSESGSYACYGLPVVDTAPIHAAETGRSEV